MAGILDFLTNSPQEIPDEVKQRRLMDWQKSMTQAGDDAMKNRIRGMELAADRASGQGSITAERQAAQKAGVLAQEAWGRSGAAATGAEALGNIGKLAMRAGGVVPQALLYSPDVGEGSELSREQIRKEMGPANAFAQEADAAHYAQRVQDNTKAAVQGYQNKPVSLMAKSDADTDSPEAIAQAQQALQGAAPQAAPEASPKVDPAVVEQAKKETESKRQVVAAGTVKALQTNQVSRPKLAEEVVKADAARKGKDLTPDQFKIAVNEETQAMKSMDNGRLGEYVSYALIAGGLIASFADKSGHAGDLFGQSMNKQLDRNLQAGLTKAKLQQKTAEANQKAAIDTYGLKLREDAGERDEKRLGLEADKTEGQLGFWDKSAANAKERIQVSREANGVAAQNVNATLGLRREQMTLNQQLAAERQANADRDYGLKKEGLAIRQAKAEAGSGPKAPDLSSKSAVDLVSQVSKESNLNLSKAAVAAVSEQVRVLQKNDPVGFARDPQSAIAKAIKAGGYETQEGGWFSSDKLGVRKSQ